jgi:hypothetical protein
MGLPFRGLSKAAKADIAKELEGTVEVGGRTMKKGDMLEAELARTDRLGRTQSDIMKALKEQGLNIPPDYVKERLAIARRRNPLIGKDPVQRKREANWIVENGLNYNKTWDEIATDLGNAGFNGPKAVELARKKHADMMAQGSGPATVIDDGTSGPNAGPGDDGAYKPPTGPVQDLADLRNVTDEELTARIKRAGDEAFRRRQESVKAARGRGAAKIEGFDWSQLDDYYKTRATPLDQSKATENDTAIPLDNAPLAPASEYANTGDAMDTPEPVAKFPE